MSKKTLFKPSLYTSEEDFQLYSVEVESNFWESDNYKEQYRIGFYNKIFNSLNNSLKSCITNNIFKGMVESSILAYMEGDNSEIDEIVEMANEEFDNKNSYFFEEIWGWGKQVGYTNNKDFHSITEEIMDTDIIASLLHNFDERLIIFRKGNKKEIIDYYIDEIYNTDIDEDEPLGIVDFEEVRKLCKVDFEELSSLIQEYWI